MTAISSWWSAKTRATPKSKPACCWKPPAARTSKWWRNNALFPDHFRALRAGGDGRPRQARGTFPPTAAVHFSGHGVATQAPTAEGQHLLPGRADVATARAGHRAPQHTHPDG